MPAVCELAAALQSLSADDRERLAAALAVPDVYRSHLVEILHHAAQAREATP